MIDDRVEETKLYFDIPIVHLSTICRLHYMTTRDRQTLANGTTRLWEQPIGTRHGCAMIGKRRRTSHANDNLWLRKSQSLISIGRARSVKS